MSQHTKGKVVVPEHQGDFHAVLSIDEDYLICDAGYSPSTETDIANARRIAACWNVCDGLDTDYIEYAARTNNFVGHVQWLTAERDELQRELNGKNAAIQRAHDRWFDAAAEGDKAKAINAELLAALEHVFNTIPTGGFAQIHYDSATYDQILAAIDKAKGGAA